MSLQTRLEALVAAIGADIKALQASSGVGAEDLPLLNAGLTPQIPLMPRFWSSYIAAAVGSNVANTTDKVLMVPFVPRRTVTLSHLNFHVTTAAANGSTSNGRLAIYSDFDEATKTLSGLVADGGSQSLLTTGIKAGPVNVTLTKDQLYFRAFFAQVSGATNPAFGCANAGASPHIPVIIGSNNWDQANEFRAILTYPASAPASVAMTNTWQTNPQRLITTGTVSAWG